MSNPQSTIEPPEKLVNDLDFYLEQFQRLQTPEDRIELFDKTTKGFCEEIASALKAEIAIWAVHEMDGHLRFKTVLSGPKIRLNCHEDTEADLDLIFSRKLVAEQRISHGESLSAPDKTLANSMKRTLGVSVTSLLCEPIGSDDSIPCILAMYRFTDGSGKKLFPSPHFSEQDIQKLNRYTSVLNRLLQYELYTKALH